MSAAKSMPMKCGIAKIIPMEGGSIPKCVAIKHRYEGPQKSADHKNEDHHDLFIIRYPQSECEIVVCPSRPLNSYRFETRGFRFVPAARIAACTVVAPSISRKTSLHVPVRPGVNA